MSHAPHHRHRLRRSTRAKVSGVALLLMAGLWISSMIHGYQTPEQNHGEAFDATAQNSALRAWDRIYRMNAALDYKATWMRRLMGQEPAPDLLEQAYGELADLWARKQLDRRGCTTLAVLEQRLFEEKPEATAAGDSQNGTAPGAQMPVFDVEPLVEQALSQTRWQPQQWQSWEQRFQEQEVFWWEVEYLEKKARTEGITVLNDEIAAQKSRNERLLHRAMVAHCGTTALFVSGMLCLPWGLRRIAVGWKAVRDDRTVRYSQRLSLSLVLLWLLATEQINNRLLEILTKMAGSLQNEWWWMVLTDSLWRTLPVAAMLWFFYRKGPWIVRSFALRQRPQWSIILSLYALLMVLDSGLSAIMAAWGNNGSSFQLDSMEHGWRGLVYGLVSACVLAPVMEEFIYRGFLFQGLSRKTGFWIAALLSSLVFAVSHFYDLYGTISVGLCGMATALAYFCSRSLTQAILLHAIYNLSITIPGWVLFHLDV